ncbi:hypothetical protein HOO65_010011 [Ceratocystis lukuohia]|uniref:DDE-1 domain-containing protein n=1 Tax=Ceratocystis lukuohia TaxID=2019550 RepID=A0ABR4MQT6_9PEZI
MYSPPPNPNIKRRPLTWTLPSDPTKPEIPYHCGASLSIRAHTPPPPFGNGYYRDVAPRPLAEWTDLDGKTQTEWCCQHPVIDTPPHPDKTIHHLHVLEEVACRDGRGAQVLRCSLDDSSDDTTYIAKIYDPLYYSYVESCDDPTWRADQDYSSEAAAYEELKKAGVDGSLAPKYYGSWTFEMVHPETPKATRSVRMILMEWIPDSVTMQSIVEGGFRGRMSPQHRLDILTKALEVNSKIDFHGPLSTVIVRGNTVIEGINADGQSIPPFIISAGKDHLANWYQQCDLPGDWVIALSENGWTNNKLGLEWLKHFDRAIAKRTNSLYRLLILDGHESHHFVEYEKYCTENKIITLCMPAHASHLLQPLGVRCFGPLKRAYSQQIEHLIRCSITHISKTDCFPAFHSAHQDAHTESNVKGGFGGAGLASFAPENVISKLDVQSRTPTPPTEVTIPSTPWTARTPKTVLEAESHSNYLQGRIRNHNSSSPESIIEAVKHFEWATNVIMHEMVLLQERV